MIISIHIRKCAGTSLREALQDLYADRALFDYGDEVGSSWPSSIEKRATRLAAAKADAQNLRDGFDLIHGHFFRSKYDFLEGPKQYVTFLRDPVERVLSNYFYLKRNPSRRNPDALIVNVLGFSLEEFASHVDNQNLQSQYLQAETLAGLDFVGLSERYAESIARLNRTLDLDIRGEDATNTNPDARSDYDISAKTRALIENANLIDMQLYDQAQERFFT